MDKRITDPQALSIKPDDPPFVQVASELLSSVLRAVRGGNLFPAPLLGI
jgi:hypothetical protein